MKMSEEEKKSREEIYADGLAGFMHDDIKNCKDLCKKEGLNFNRVYELAIHILIGKILAR